MISMKGWGEILPDLLFKSRNVRMQRIFIVGFLFLVIYSLLIIIVMPTRFLLEVGQVSPESVYAPRDFIDEYTTEKLREEAALAVTDLYKHDPGVLEEAEASLEVFFVQLHLAREQEEYEKKVRYLEALELNLSPVMIESLLALDDATINEVHRRSGLLLADFFEQGIKPDALALASGLISQEIELLTYIPEVNQVMEKLILPLVRPNMFPDLAATAEKREEAREAVEPVLVPRGVLLLNRGERVTEKHLNNLETLGLLRGADIDYFRYAGLFIFLLVLFLIVGIYLVIYAKDLYNSPSLIFLIGLTVIITLGFAFVAGFFSGYLIPAAMGAFLVAVLLDTRLAILINIVIAVSVGLITGGEFNFMFVALAGGMAAIYGVSRLHRRNDLARAGLYVAAVNAVTIFAFFLLTVEFRLDYIFLHEFGKAILSGIASGLFSAVVAIGLLPYLESAFGLTTAITLLELANPNHPLLKEMLMKAPGSYHHSIIVGNLAEAAAEELDADPLLARVGAYYHDIGKVKRPYFFSENQFGGENPHDTLSPNLSALIIRSHVKDGYEMAKSAKLPVVVTDIIKQHHGTCFASFFHQKARSSEEPNVKEFLEEDFRYEGPLPQTKEAALVMLADAVEAAVHSLSRPAPGRIESTVRKVIKKKLNDNQLDESALTLKDLDKIANIFVHILSGIFHTRIKYPEKELKAEIEGSHTK